MAKKRKLVEKLHTDLWGVILRRLPISDYVRSGAVCRSWRRATARNPHRQNAKSPWLMFPGDEEGSDDPDYFSFFTIADLKPRRLRLPQIRGKRIEGSSNGYIIASGPTEILLLDPLTSAEVRLPPITLNYSREIKYPLIEKLIFSPSSSTAATIYLDVDSQDHYLSFARVGDASWTGVFEGVFFYDCPLFSDVIIHRGEFYVLGRFGWLRSFDPSAGGEMKVCHGYGVSFLHQYHRMYLVESLDGDHLLLVCRMMNKKWWVTNSFKVFRQDKVGHQWVEVGSLGEVAIFVGNNYSTCIFTRGLPDLRGNCVYFTEDQTLQHARGYFKLSDLRENSFYITEDRILDQTGDDDFGVFSLEDGSIQQHVAFQHIRPSMLRPFWVMHSSS